MSSTLLAPITSRQVAEPVALLDTERFETILLLRHGLRPLGFSGRVLFEVSQRDPALRVWSRVAVYEREDERLVASIHHQLRGAAPLSRHFAEACAGIDAVLAFLHAHDPLRDLPVEALYAEPAPVADESADDPTTGADTSPETDPGLAAHDAAAARAAGLRRAWRQLLDTCFGTRNTSGEFQ